MSARTSPILPLLAAFLLVAAGDTKAQSTQQYTQTNLVSDSPSTAEAKTYDPNAGSSWGIAQSSNGPWAVANANKGTVTVYSGAGAIEVNPVSVAPANPEKSKVGSPTGVVFNPSQEFVLSNGKPAEFLASTLDGLIVGWNSGLPGNASSIVINQKDKSIFDGLGIASATVKGVTATYLYAPDFKAGRMSVYDGAFQHTAALENAFNRVVRVLFETKDLAPFNVQEVGGNVYVTFAQPDPSIGGIVPIVQAGLGLVICFSPEGKLIQVLQEGQFLNGPWGVALAPGNFGQYSHDLLVANNGDGAINVYNPVTGQFIAQLQDASAAPLKISGLWGIAFGSDTALGGLATSLYFAASAGPTFSGGLFGDVTPVQNAFGSSN